jgi:hypothetical protein
MAPIQNAHVTLFLTYHPQCSPSIALCFTVGKATSQGILKISGYFWLPLAPSPYVGMLSPLRVALPLTIVAQV